MYLGLLQRTCHSLNVWKFLPKEVDFTSLPRFKCTVQCVDFSGFLKCFYRAMHLSAYARSWNRMSSVRPSVCPSVTLVICDHTGWKSRKPIARTISPTPSLLAAERRST